MKIKGGYVAVIIAVILLIVVIVGFSTRGPDSDQERAAINEPAVVENNYIITGSEERIIIDPLSSTFEFEGYAPGKSHIGTFDELSGDLFVKDGNIVGFEGIIDSTSVNTGIGGLDKHLVSDDFFDTQKYDEIRFTTTSLGDSVMSGDLTFKGVTHSVTFPVIITESTISADFVLDVSEFGIKYVGIDEEVRIEFMFSK